MKASVFKRAAELIEKETFACHAIRVSRENVKCYHDTSYEFEMSDEEKFFHDLFKPKEAHYEEAYFGKGEITFSMQLSRELALLFTYYMVKDLQ